MPRFFKLSKRIKALYSTPIRAVASSLFLIAVVIAVLEITNVTHIFHKPPQTTQVVTVGTPVRAPKTKASTQPINKTPSGGTAASANSGGATDTQGNATVSTPSSQWVTSASGYITVKQPVANATLKDGDVLSGSAKVGTVNYRLSDNEVGVIAQGALSVVNGNFSGTLHFKPTGTGGRLDVFSTDSKGVEYNEVQINVSF